MAGGSDSKKGEGMTETTHMLLNTNFLCSINFAILNPTKHQCPLPDVKKFVRQSCAAASEICCPV